MPRLSLRADAGIGTAAVSPNSRDAVLAGRSGLYIVDLHDPFALPRWLPLRSAWEVSRVQWCPHPDRPAWIVSSSNQKTLVWNLALQSDRAVEHVLHGHKRAVTDIDFSPFHLDQLATASIDTTVKVWDLRQTNGCAMTFADFHAGAIQVRWSSTNEYQVASANDNRLVLWDKRKANLPLFNFQAHQGECNGVQFLANGKILTCSTDRSIKIWNLRGSENKDLALNNNLEHPTPELTIEAGFPVWRAVPTPFELGAVIAPLRGGDNKLSLINLARQSGTKKISELTITSGFPHSKPVNTAMFMRTEMSSSHYDIVTWSQDSHLREWDGSVLMELPHASSAAGCKDDKPPPLPETTRTFNTSEFDKKDAHAVSENLFELPILNRKTKDEAQSIAQLDWIAGVRMDRERMLPKDSNIKAQKEESNPLTKSTSAAASAEFLSQEIISISSRFPKVSFGDINIGAGICDFSLYGPWGNDGAIIRVFLDARVPVNYPYQPLKITVQDDSEIKEGGADEISQKLLEATNELSRHGVRSLEFCIRYLVGDSVSIEDSLAANDPSLSDIKLAAETDKDQAMVDETDNGLTSLDPTLLKIDYSALSDKDFIEDEDEDEDEDEEGEKAGMIDSTGDASSSTSDERYNEIGEKDNTAHANYMHTKNDDIIDSTPVPKNCGAVWSVTGQLVCFFNHKPAKKDKGPLPLDKIFAEDNKSEESNAPFVSDSEDFEQEALLPTTNWSVTAAQLTVNPSMYGSSNAVGGIGPSSSAAVAATAAVIGGNLNTNMGFNANKVPSASLASDRKRSRTTTSRTSIGSEDFSFSMTQGLGHTATHVVSVKNMVHLWPSRPDVATEYWVDISSSPLQIAEHNAQVAAKYELWDDENIWRMIIEYINIEESECTDRNAAISCEDPKFDWCGGSTGLRFYLPKIAHSLEQQGKVQLLACISIILSSLRTRRTYLRKLTSLAQSHVKPVAIFDPQVEVHFQAHPDGTVSMLSHLHLDDGSVYSKELSPFDAVGSTATVSDASWLEPELSGLSLAPTETPPDMATTGSRKHSTQYLHPPHSGIQHRRHSYLDGHESVQNSAYEGPIIGIEVESQLFDLDSPPSTYIVRRKSGADIDFSSWLPRLLEYRKTYASLLRIWGLYIKCAEVTKVNPDDPLVQERYNEIIESTHLEDAWIDIEATTNAPCALCNSPIVRLFEYCDKCSHVLHSECAQQWWKTERECPSACGCTCKKYVTGLSS